MSDAERRDVKAVGNPKMRCPRCGSIEWFPGAACWDCGWEAGMPVTTECPACHGSGRVYGPHLQGVSFVLDLGPCRSCDGRGAT